MEVFVPAAAEPKGLKRICMGCGTRFYDFNKRPIICPSCKAEFLIEVKTKTRRRAANDEAVAKPAPKDAEDEEATENSDTVSLDEVEEDEADEDMDDAGPDLEIDEDIDDLEDDDMDDDDDEEDEEEDKG
jgi:uncharacterized protein (TIGR02300 family)